MNPFFSFIIPVYNAQSSLTKCVYSILKQDFTSFEIILIDDGSSDESYEVCKLLQQQDVRIVIIHQENRGVSSARNRGIDAAQGKYLFFVDADDFISEDTLHVLYWKVQNSSVDICAFGYSYVHEGKIRQTVLPKNFCGEINPAVLLNLIEINAFGFAWNKIILREFLVKNQIRFDEEIHIFED